MNQPPFPLDGQVSLWKPQEYARPTMRVITQATAEKHGFTHSVLIGRGGGDALDHARQEAWATIRSQTRLSLVRIGRYFDDRDHSTIRHGVLAHQRRVAG